MKLIIRAEAESDLAEAYAWYEEHSLGLGAEFVQEVEEGFSVILESPNRFPRLHKDIRRALTKRFPYGIFYYVDEDKVVVFAVTHQWRNPVSWQSRR